MKTIISPINFRKDRLPPGQHWSNKLHILDIAGPPDIDLSQYRFKLFGAVDKPTVLTWEDIQDLEKVKLIADFHCVTRWSCPDVEWVGFHVNELKKLVNIDENVKAVMVHSLDGYTTNIPIEYFFDEDVIFAYELNGRPIPADHGYPLRLVVPKLYAWKSAKFVSGVEFLLEDRPGFWEQRGYHMRGDPWKEERYSL